MKHVVGCGGSEPAFVVCVWGPSVSCGGDLAERSFWSGGGDLLFFRGSRVGLLCVRAVFAAAPGLFALRVVRSLDSVLASPVGSGWLPGV